MRLDEYRGELRWREGSKKRIGVVSVVVQELPKAFNEAEGEEDVVATTTTSTTALCSWPTVRKSTTSSRRIFPISFKPPQNDSVKITREELASGLKAAMTATNCYAPFAIPHVLESVVSSGEDRRRLSTAVSGEACADAIDCLETMGAEFGWMMTLQRTKYAQTFGPGYVYALFLREI